MKEKFHVEVIRTPIEGDPSKADMDVIKTNSCEMLARAILGECTDNYTFPLGPNEIAYKHMMSKAHEEEERAAHAGQTRMYTATSVSYDPDDGHTACVQTIVSRTEQGALDWIGETICDTICCLPVFAESFKTGCGDKGMWRTNLSTGGLSGEPLLQGYLVAEMLMTDTDMNPIRTQFFIDDCWV